jgi:hypothetical protein
LASISKFMSHNIVNDDTLEVLRMAMDEKEVQPWPGTDFATSTEEGLALIGSLKSTSTFHAAIVLI